MAVELSKVQSECLKIMLKPIAKYCLKNSLTLQKIIECAKVVLIETAIDEMKERGDKVNYSRLSIMTGVHRKEVRRIDQEGEKTIEPINYVREVIGQWEQNKAFTTSRGKPRVLTTEGEESEFKELVKTVTVDVNPATILFELERVGAVEKGPRGVKLVKQHYKVSGDDPTEGIRLLSRDTNDLVLAVEENILEGGKSPNLHARTAYDNIYVKDLPRVKKWLVEEGAKFHKKARDFIAKHDKDVSPAEGKKKAGGTVILTTYGRVIE